MNEDDYTFFWALFFIAFFLISVFVVYVVAYDEGYYDAKKEDYCHNYCEEISGFNVYKYDFCYNLCVKEESYSNQWIFEEEKE